MAGFAPVAGHPEDVEMFNEYADAARDAFNAKYFDGKEGFYGNNTVTANLLPLYFGMVPAGREGDVFNHIVRKTEVDCDGHVSCGVVGMMVLMRTLTEFGRPDPALRVATTETYTSWG